MEQLNKKYMDIEGILEKVKNLPIDNKDKADILQSFKYNIQNPSIGETQNLDQIQQKYMNPNLQQSSNYINIPSGNNLMTTTHFEILKSKLDSLQLELVDLLRHVKDYTQRYMNAIRQQDMEKIDQYINGLFQVDKAMKETQQRAEEAESVAAAAEIPEEPTKEGILDRATSGISNFFGGIGDNVSKLTGFVSETASKANNLLSKKIINNKPPEPSNTTQNTSGNTSTKLNKNEISVEEYMSNMGNLEGELPTNISNKTNPNIVSSSMNNINSIKSTKNNISNTKNNISNTNKTVEKIEEDEDLGKALKQLNEAINNDIEKTVNNKSVPETQSGGNRNEYKLSHKIKMLKLKLTKKRLQKQLEQENKTNNTNKKKHLIPKRINIQKTKRKH